MNKNCGFTLIEVLITGGILVCGLVAVASVFSFVVRTNASNRQMAIATTLLSDKMEEFSAAPFDDPIWKTSEDTEVLTVADARYVRAWRVGSGSLRVVTVVIYAKSNAFTGRQTELVRATTFVSPTF